MTHEEKTKAYDEAKARMSRAYNSNRCTISFMNEIFPEFKISEDERIRKEIVRFIQMEVEDEIVGNEWLAWLEKQGEQKLANNDKHEYEEIINGIIDFVTCPNLLLPNRKQKYITFLEDMKENGRRIHFSKKVKSEKQVVLITESNGNAYIDWDTRSLEDARKLLECGLQYINTELEKQGGQETLCDKCRKEHSSHSCQDITALERCAVEHKQKPIDKVEPKFKTGDWITIKE